MLRIQRDCSVTQWEWWQRSLKGLASWLFSRKKQLLGEGVIVWDQSLKHSCGENGDWRHSRLCGWGNTRPTPEPGPCSHLLIRFSICGRPQKYPKSRPFCLLTVLQGGRELGEPSPSVSFFHTVSQLHISNGFRQGGAGGVGWGTAGRKQGGWKLLMYS